MLSFKFVHNFLRLSHILLTIDDGLVNIDIVEGDGWLRVLVPTESTHAVIGALVIVSYVVVESLAVKSLIVIANVVIVVEALVINLAVRPLGVLVLVQIDPPLSYARVT